MHYQVIKNILIIKLKLKNNLQKKSLENHLLIKIMVNYLKLILIMEEIKRKNNN